MQLLNRGLVTLFYKKYLKFNLYNTGWKAQEFWAGKYGQNAIFVVPEPLFAKKDTLGILALRKIGQLKFFDNYKKLNVISLSELSLPLAVYSRIAKGTAQQGQWSIQIPRPTYSFRQNAF